MRFQLVDRITEFEPGVQLKAIKNVTLSEEYLADHFPKFPVLPGVFMVEAMAQAAAWLVRMSENYAHSIITLKETRNIKYADFVAPGHSLHMNVEVRKQVGNIVHFKCKGTIEGNVSVSGRLAVECYNLATQDPAKEYLDRKIIANLRTMQGILTAGLQTPAALPAVPASVY